MMSFLDGRCTHVFWRVCTNVCNCPASIKLSSNFFFFLSLETENKKSLYAISWRYLDAAEMFSVLSQKPAKKAIKTSLIFGWCGNLQPCIHGLYVVHIISALAKNQQTQKTNTGFVLPRNVR